MTIDYLKIYGYGKWIDTEISFNQSLEMIYGPNEAGKSTIIDFIISVLFGFQSKRQAIHGQYIPKNHQDMYGGEIIFRYKGRRYRLIRTKGPKGGTVRFFDEDQHTELSEDDYQKIISPLDRNAYQQLFYFDGEDQQAAYQMSEDELRTRIQQIGITNSDQWFGLQKELEKQAKSIYSERGRKPELNLQLKRYQELEDKVQSARQDYLNFQTLKKEAVNTSNQLKTARLNLKKRQGRSRENQRIASSFPLLAKYNELQLVNESQLQEGFSDADVLTFQTMNSRISSYQDQLKANKKQMEEISSEINESPAQRFYEQNKVKIDELTAQLVEVKNKLPQFRFVGEQLADNQQQLTKIQNDLPRNKSGQFPTPFNDADLILVTTMLNQSQNVETKVGSRLQQRGRSNDRSNYLIYLIAGIIVLLTILLHRFAFSWMGYFVAGFVAWYGFSQQQTGRGRSVQSQYTQVGRFDDQLTTLVSKYRLEGISQSQWLSIQPGLRRLLDLIDQENKLKSQQTSYLQQINHFLAKWQFASHWIPSNDDVLTHLAIIDQTVSQWRKQQDNYQSRKAGARAYEQTIAHLQDQLNSEQGKLIDFLSKRHLKSEDGFYDMLNRQKHIQAKLERKKELFDQLKSAGMSDIQEMDRDGFQKQSKALENELSQLHEQIDNLTQKQTKLTIQMNDLISNGRYYDLKQELANQKSEILENVHKFLAISLSYQWLQRVLDIATKGRLPKAIKGAKAYFSVMTQGNYSDVRFGDHIMVTRADGEQFNVNELSKGTLEQLYLSLVFSMAVGFSDDYPLPIIIDDGFMSFDATRKKAAFDVMKTISKHTQVLYFSAHRDLSGNLNTIDLTRI